ncbi:ATP-dependent protease ATPase subunit HslU [Christensenella timonensis]|uniref:ATP-dependent protease ATPase subunit HslU n=1 Tax=Christensenella timonensis TaxID=1816678 RepID=UPI000830263C|nr:ATP-dependent protease ATPase subunit HslU [Christensenella timonensis]
MSYLTPKEIVAELDKYIVGQDKAKRAVAIALRNRYRRSKLDEEMREEITPKNIIMMGPTGVGKTEIARRLSKLMDAPFVKVEATKFTEVGYVGRDVESMIRDLVEASIRMVKQNRFETVKDRAAQNAEDRLVDILVPNKQARQNSNPLGMLFGAPQIEAPPAESDEEKQKRMSRRDEVRANLRAGKLDTLMIEIEVEVTQNMGMEIPGMGGESMGDLLSGILPSKTKKRKVSVPEARKILEQEEAEKLIDMDEVTQTAIERAEQDGIIFLDEIDKVAGKGMGSGPDISREGVQRDILPIVEGSTVVTKYGPVKTDYMLFIAAGAFHVAKISDLIPELQGRFPIKVELENLTKKEFEEILTQPKNAITKQYEALLSADGVNLVFTPDALKKIAEFAQIVNESTENIGARRLHTIMENLLNDISFNANGIEPAVEVVIDENYVVEHLKNEEQYQNLQKFIL